MFPSGECHDQFSLKKDDRSQHGEWIGRSTGGSRKPSEGNIAGPGGEVIVEWSGVAEAEGSRLTPDEL